MTADATATFALVLDDETSGAAKSAATSLADLKEKIDEDTKALSAMNKAMRQMRAAGLSGSATFKKIENSAAAMKAKIGQAQAGFARMGGQFGATGDSTKVAAKKAADAAKQAAKAFDLDLKEKAKDAAAATKQLGTQVSTVGGPIASMSSKLSALAGVLATPVGIALALAAAFLAVAAAIGVATVALLKWGVAASGARRSEALQIEGLNTLRQQWGRATASVEEFQAAIDRASDSTNIGRGQLQGYARSLSRAGLRGEALTEAVEAMGIAAQVQGDRGAARFRALAINARLTGGSVRDLAADYRDRLGPIARRQMLSIGNQTERARRSLDRIFSGLRLEPFLEALDGVLSLLSQSTATGRALKVIFEALFQPLIDQIGTVGPIVRRFFQGFVIGALVVTIWIQRMRNALNEAFGGGDFVDNATLVKAAILAGVVAFAAFTIVVGATAVVLALAAASMLVFVATLLLVPALVVAAGVAIGFALGAVIEFFQETDFGALARSMIDGIVNGIQRGVARVAGAVRNLAAGARDAFTDALGIASPSSVFAGFGLNIAQGTTQGIEAGTPAVEDAASSLVEAPGGAGIGGSVSLSFGDINVNAGESSDPRELAMQLRDELASILEGVGIEMGVAT
jgi:hypothetical protein